MRQFGIPFALPYLFLPQSCLAAITTMAEGDPHRAKHVIVIVQENHSFDNYFGSLAYAPDSPYHSPKRDGGE
jgi:phospholipase C